MRASRTHRYRRRGSAYAIVLLVSALVAAVGLAGLQAARIEGRIAERSVDAAGARLLARAGVDYTLHLMTVTSPGTWRTDFQGGLLPTDMHLGRGVFSVEAHDPVDGDVASTATDPVVLKATGRDTIIDTGAWTNMSIEHTARTGADKGYTVIVPEDCCSTMNADWHNASINYAMQNVATVASVDEVVAALG